MKTFFYFYYNLNSVYSALIQFTVLVKFLIFYNKFQNAKLQISLNTLVALLLFNISLQFLFVFVYINYNLIRVLFSFILSK